MELCKDADCIADAIAKGISAEHSHLPLFDPPGTTRMDIIRERLAAIAPDKFFGGQYHHPDILGIAALAADEAFSRGHFRGGWLTLLVEFDGAGFDVEAVLPMADER